MSDHPSNIERGPSGSVVVPLHRAAPPSCEGVGLASLAGHALAGRFCAWHGLSGRRYVASAHPVDRAAPDLGLPDYDSCILIAVGGAPGARRILDVVAVERAADRRGLLARAAAAGAGEWHVHLLAEDRRTRAAVLDDLRARHCPAEVAARCA